MQQSWTLPWGLFWFGSSRSLSSAGYMQNYSPTFRLLKLVCISLWILEWARDLTLEEISQWTKQISPPFCIKKAHTFEKQEETRSLNQKQYWEECCYPNPNPSGNSQKTFPRELSLMFLLPEKGRLVSPSSYLPTFEDIRLKQTLPGLHSSDQD